MKKPPELELLLHYKAKLEYHYEEYYRSLLVLSYEENDLMKYYYNNGHARGTFEGAWNMLKLFRTEEEIEQWRAILQTHTTEPGNECAAVIFQEDKE